uniref:ditrans,polycis-polyprenyl diphosphate synthase [(2E,6E)-farnesyldiphosphate specific] n=1 Tax=Strigamia maritima TaxID=126957 RepID=T1J1N9_STRMM
MRVDITAQNVYELILRAMHLTVDVLVAIFHYLHIWKFISPSGRREVAPKIPKHIGFLIAEAEISFKDLSNLIIWAMTLGITCISLYDHDGVIKKNKEVFRKQLSSKRQLLESERNHLHFHTDSNLVLNNGCHVLLKVLCHLDGKWTITKTANSICQEIEENELISTQIDTELITDRLRHQTSDPDVVIVFGSVYSSLGFLPWHIRLTELFVLPTHHHLRKHDFYDILDRFVKCEQRLGR